MKYIKLFEAFESNILSKTLSYLSDKSKDNFLKSIRSYCGKIDFPLSKISDDYFKYLPYSKALKDVISAEDIVEDCKATSDELFGDKAVGGDICTGGKIKRKWGKGIRSVECPKCLGTGKIKVGDPDAPKGYELIKFWIDDKKDIVTVTLTDGKGVTDTSKSIGGYTAFGKVYGRYDYRDLSDIPNLQTVFIKWEHRRDPTLGTIYNTGDRIYVIHNNSSQDGASSSGDDWKKYGKYSWSVGINGSYYTIQMCQKSVEDGEINYYNYNRVTDFTFKGSKTPLSTKKLEGVNFAIVFDTGKLKNSEYIKKSKINADRKETKSGIIGGKLGISDKDIKSQNLDKYIKALASKNIKGEMSDLMNLDTYIFRVLGGKNLIFKFINDEVEDIDKIINSFFKMLKVNEEYGSKYDDYEEEYYREKLVEFMEQNPHLRDKMNNEYRLIYRKNDQIPVLKVLKYLYDKYIIGKHHDDSEESTPTSNIKSMLTDLFKKSMEENQKINDEVKKSKSQILSVVIDVSEHIYNKLKSFGKVETLIDAELLQQKIKSISNVLGNDRWYFSKFIKGRKTPNDFIKLRYPNKEAQEMELEKLKAGAEEIKKNIDRI